MKYYKVVKITNHNQWDNRVLTAKQLCNLMELLTLSNYTSNEIDIREWDIEMNCFTEGVNY